MCDKFSCRYCYLDLISSGDSSYQCSIHDCAASCDSCFLANCDQCRYRFGSCRDSALTYFKEVLINGKKHKVNII